MQFKVNSSSCFLRAALIVLISGLPNSESSKSQIDQHKFAAVRKRLFRCIWKKFWKDS